MTRGFDYQTTDLPDCLTCYMCINHLANGHICGYDEQPVQRGHRCSLYIVASKPVEKEPVKQNQLF